MTRMTFNSSPYFFLFLFPYFLFFFFNYFTNKSFFFPSSATRFSPFIVPCSSQSGSYKTLFTMYIFLKKSLMFSSACNHNQSLYIFKTMSTTHVLIEIPFHKLLLLQIFYTVKNAAPLSGLVPGSGSAGSG